jgi:hypothetical protein
VTASKRDYMATAVALTTLAVNDQWDDIDTTLNALQPADWPFLTACLVGFAAAAYTPGELMKLGLNIARGPE